MPTNVKRFLDAFYCITFVWDLSNQRQSLMISLKIFLNEIKKITTKMLSVCYTVYLKRNIVLVIVILPKHEVRSAVGRGTSGVSIGMVGESQVGTHTSMSTGLKTGGLDTTDEQSTNRGVGKSGAGSDWWESTSLKNK